MVNINIDLPVEVAERLTDRAVRDGQDVAGYVRHLAMRDAARMPRPASDGDAPARPYNAAGLVAALNAFDEDDEQEQRETLAFLRTALDRDRPGQRRVFGEGVNPMPPEGDDA